MTSKLNLDGIARTTAPLAMVLFFVGVASACPTCTDGLAQNDPQGHAIAAGFYYSILFMMAMPFAILATFGGMAYLSVRRAQQASALSIDGKSAPSQALVDVELVEGVRGLNSTAAPGSAGG